MAPRALTLYSRRTWRYPVSGLVALVGLRFPIADVYLKHTGQQLDRQQIAEKVRTLGFEIYAGKGCTEYGVAGTIAEICRNIFTGSHRALAISCILDGEYGMDDVAVGVPAVLAQSGVQQIIELQLAEDEAALFRHSVEVIKANIARLA